MNGNAPIAFTVTADPFREVRIDSLTIDRTSGAAIIFQFQEAGDTVGPSVTLNSGNSLDDALLASPVIIGPGDTKTFTINVNSGNLDSRHNLDAFTLNGKVTAIPEPHSIAIWSILGICLAGYGYRRRRRNS